MCPAWPAEIKNWILSQEAIGKSLSCLASRKPWRDVKLPILRRGHRGPEQCPSTDGLLPKTIQGSKGAFKYKRGKSVVKLGVDCATSLEGAWQLYN